MGEGPGEFKLFGGSFAFVNIGQDDNLYFANLLQRKILKYNLTGKYIDGYNVLFTIMNYLFGKFIFTGNDGLLRDCGEVYGKVENEALFYRAVDILLEYLKKGEPAAIEIKIAEAVAA